MIAISSAEAHRIDSARQPSHLRTLVSLPGESSAPLAARKCVQPIIDSTRLSAIAIAMFLITGCRANMTLPRPVDPQHIAVQTNLEAPVEVVVQVDSFTLGEIKTNFGAQDMRQFRQDMPIMIGNALFGALAGGRAFRTVKRSSAGPSADFIVSGRYDHTSYVGTRGREWIPFAGTFGAPINEATVHEVLHVKVMDAATGEVVFSQQFAEDQSEWTSIYTTAEATWFQPNFVARVSQGVADAIRARAVELAKGRTGSPGTSSPRIAARPATADPPSNEGDDLDRLQAIRSIHGHVANVVFFVDDEIDPQRLADFLGRCNTAKPRGQFSRTDTSFVWICVFISPDDGFLPGSAVLTADVRRGEDRSLVTWLPTATLEVKSDDQYGVVLQGYGARERGKIDPGRYVVGIYSANEKVGEGYFEVSQ
jgi:hypothetical protein